MRLDATSSPDSESGSEACSQPSGFGSHHRWSVHFADASGEGPAIRRRVKAIDADAFSQDADEAKVPPPVFTQTGPTARSQRTHERTHRRRCGNEAAQSHLGLQANCTAYRSGLRHRDRQRRRSANSGNPFPARSELKWRVSVRQFSVTTKCASLTTKSSILPIVKMIPDP